MWSMQERRRNTVCLQTLGIHLSSNCLLSHELESSYSGKSTSIIQIRKKCSRKKEVKKEKIKLKLSRIMWNRPPTHLVQSAQLSWVQSLSRVQLFVTPRMEEQQASLSIPNSRSSLRLTAIESVMPSSHLILCCPLLFLPPIPPSIRVSYSHEVAKVLEFQLQHQSFQWTPRTDLL